MSIAKTMRGGHMNKFIATVICLVVLSAASLPVAAQTRSRQCNNRTVYSTRQDSRYRTTRYGNTAYRNDNYRYDDYRYDDDYYGANRSVWEKHRDKITTAAGAGGGADLHAHDDVAVAGHLEAAVR